MIESLFKAAQIDLPSSGTVVETRTVILALAVGTVLTVLAALIPALRATRVEPVEGMREGVVVETPRTRRLRSAIAVVLTVAGLLVMLAGVFGVIGPRVRPGSVPAPARCSSAWRCSARGWCRRSPRWSVCRWSEPAASPDGWRARTRSAIPAAPPPPRRR